MLTFRMESTLQISIFGPSITKPNIAVQPQQDQLRWSAESLSMRESSHAIGAAQISSYNSTTRRHRRVRLSSRTKDLNGLVHGTLRSGLDAIAV